MSARARGLVVARVQPRGLRVVVRGLRQRRPVPRADLAAQRPGVRVFWSERDLRAGATAESLGNAESLGPRRASGRPGAVAFRPGGVFRPARHQAIRVRQRFGSLVSYDLLRSLELAAPVREFQETVGPAP